MVKVDLWWVALFASTTQNLFEEIWHFWFTIIFLLLLNHQLDLLLRVQGCRCSKNHNFWTFSPPDFHFFLDYRFLTPLRIIDVSKPIELPEFIDCTAELVDSTILGLCKNLNALVKVFVKLNDLCVILCLIVKLGHVVLNKVFPVIVSKFAYLSFSNKTVIWNWQGN